MENNLKLDNKLDYIFRYDSLGQFIEYLTFKKLFSLDKCAHLGFKYLSMEGTIFNSADHNIELHPDSATLGGNLIYKATKPPPAQSCGDPHCNMDQPGMGGTSCNLYFNNDPCGLGIEGKNSKCTNLWGQDPTTGRYYNCSEPETPGGVCGPMITLCNPPKLPPK